jgi:hypothetical protein
MVMVKDVDMIDMAWEFQLRKFILAPFSTPISSLPVRGQRNATKSSVKHLTFSLYDRLRAKDGMVC